MPTRVNPHAHALATRGSGVSAACRGSCAVPRDTGRAHTADRDALHVVRRARVTISGCSAPVSASRRRRPAICTSAARARRSSTGSTRAATAARSSCASRTPTSSARRPTWSRASSTACAGSARLGRRARASADRTRRTSRPSGSIVPRAAQALVASGHAYRCYCKPEDLKAKREAAQAAGRGLDLRPHVPQLSADDRVARARPPARRTPIRFLVPAGRTTFDDLVHGAHRVRPRQHRGLRHPPLRRLSHLPPVGRRRRRGHGDHARGARRRPHLEHAEAGAAVSGDGRAGAGVRARAAHSRARQEAPEQAPRRDVGRRVRDAGLSAGGDGQLPRAARLVAGQRRRSCSRATSWSRDSRSTASAAATPCSIRRSSTGSTSSTSCGCRRGDPARGCGPDLDGRRLLIDRRASAERARTRAAIDLVKPRAQEARRHRRAAAAVSSATRSSAIRRPCAKHLSAPDLRPASGGVARRGLRRVTPFDAGAARGRAARTSPRRAASRPAPLIHATRVAVTGQAVSPGLFEVLELIGRDRVRRAADRSRAMTR